MTTYCQEPAEPCSECFELSQVSCADIKSEGRQYHWRDRWKDCRGSHDFELEQAKQRFAVDVAIEMNTSKVGSADGNKNTDIGFGGSYYYPMETGSVYGGVGFLMGSTTAAGATEAMKANYLNIKAGYLYGLTENWYFDIGLRYNMGMGKVKSGSTEVGDNEVTNMTFGVGIATFF